MKILVTTLAIALTIGTAIAALHPPSASLRDEEPAAPPHQPSPQPVTPITPKPVKTETIQGTATDPIYARYQKIWTFPVPNRAGNARGLTEQPQ